MSASTEQYEVIKKIGEGGMGIVYLARDTILQRFVAIKELRNPSLQAEGNFADRFRQEAFALAQLNHRNITHIYAFVPYNTYYWMVMEYVEGDTLEAWMGRHKNISVSKASDLVEQVLAGLVHAHKKGIIHRDIKPANIIINEEGDIKIMDFGIARINNNVKRLTSHGKTLGTLEYMAPEQIQGKEGDERSDIYAVGSIFYELLCGHPPFEKMPDFELMKAKLEKNVKPPSAIGIKIPAPLQKVIMKSLERNSAHRYSTAQAFIDAIKECSLVKAESGPGKKFLRLNIRAIRGSNLLKKTPQEPLSKKSDENTNSPLPFKLSLPVLLLCTSALLSIALLWWANTGKSNDTAIATAKSNQQYWEKPVSVPDREVTSALGIISIDSDSIPFNETPNEMLERISKKKDDEIAEGKPKIKERIPSKVSAEKTPIEEESGHFSEGGEVKYPTERDKTARREKITSNETVSLMLTESLSSEDKSKDGQMISLRVVNDIIVDGVVWIRKGATATGKIADVVPSNNRKKAVIGFIIRSITTTDGNEIKVSSSRYRNFATDLNEPTYFSSGQVFTVQTGRGRPRR
ncbi:MAG TPA: serine/threonine-protein kinase [Niabella sp.]|nr:serine/threonine-protein kinase [Niabella sp.]